VAGEVHVVLLFTDSDGRAVAAVAAMEAAGSAPLSPDDADAARSRAGTVSGPGRAADGYRADGRGGEDYIYIFIYIYIYVCVCVYINISTKVTHPSYHMRAKATLRHKRIERWAREGERERERKRERERGGREWSVCER
jgi:hypothetical protein